MTVFSFQFSVAAIEVSHSCSAIDCKDYVIICGTGGN